MHLQQRTDYALRLLMYLALGDDRPAPVGEVARSFGISVHHLAKVAQRLRELGYLETVRGRHGGFRLAMRPDSVRVGDVVRHLEDLTLVECFDPSKNQCAITGMCGLRSALREAQARFLEILDGYTLADFVGPRRAALSRVLDVVAG